MNENLKKYYEYLKSAGADAPDSYESFELTLSNSANAKEYYNYLKGKGFDVPDSYESFSETLGLKKKGSFLDLVGSQPLGLEDFSPERTEVAEPSSEVQQPLVSGTDEERFGFKGVEPKDIETVQDKLTPEIKTKINPVIDMVLAELTKIGISYQKGVNHHVPRHPFQDCEN
jgi:hypothetical protein